MGPINETDGVLNVGVADKLFKLPKDNWNSLKDEDKAHLCKKTSIQVHKQCILQGIERHMMREKVEILRRQKDVKTWN